MNQQEYLKGALLTVNPESDHIQHYLDGLATEAGELLDCFKKVWYGNEVDRVHLLEECGDAAWYITVLFHHLGLELKFPKKGLTWHEDPHSTARAVFCVASEGMIHLLPGEQAISREKLLVRLDLLMGYLTYFVVDYCESSWPIVWEMNNKKLHSRFKGKFETEKANSRNVELEREVLERVRNQVATVLDKLEDIE